VLVSEEELGKSGDATSSTIIGKKPLPSGNLDSDIRLAGDSAIAGASDLQLGVSSSDLNLAMASDIGLAGGSELKLSPGDTGLHSTSGISLGSGKLDFAADSALDLGDEELVLGGSSGVGSDVTLGGGDSGINLASPADSGLSLEDEPLDLMGSSVDAFELPEDDEVMTLSSDLEDDPGTPLKADEEFMLSPAGSFGGDDSDSGSQVIALEDSEAFDENADTMLRPGGQAIFVEEDAAGSPLGAAPVMVGPGMAAAPAGYAVQPAEAPYTIWNVLGLVCCSLLLAVSLMMMTDLMRNMWAFNEDRIISTSLMDGILSAFGMR
jgi:hypothetical protein